MRSKFVGRMCTLLPSLLIAPLLAEEAKSQGMFPDLPRLSAGSTACENALWIETPLHRQFMQSKRVVVADLQGPGIITMIHFALPERMAAQPKTYRLGRELILQMFWDDEESPSVQCPLVDFFCDPAGERDRLETALVNKKRGWNAYFTMPFRKSARVELRYDGPVEPGKELWSLMPCYSYVLAQKMDSLPDDFGYFHAFWRQELVNLGKQDYIALATKGRGKFIGWNVTVRLPGRPGYPVDENEKFYIDEESEPSIEFQGIEDSFGFSWGFPPEENTFLLTGWFPFHNEGAAAYRFFLHDAIAFQKSLVVSIGFGKNEHPMFREQFSRPGNELEISSTVYWYQTEPHEALPPLPPVDKRSPTEVNWKDREELPDLQDLERRGVKLHLRCGRPEKELIFAQEGYSAKVIRGFAYTGWPFPIFHTRADEQEVQIILTVPAKRRGILRLYVIDPDHFQGGRHQEILVNDKSFGEVQGFDRGKWLDLPLDESFTQTGEISVRIKNLNPQSNAVVSIVEWAEPKEKAPPIPYQQQ